MNFSIKAENNSLYKNENQILSFVIAGDSLANVKSVVVSGMSKIVNANSTFKGVATGEHGVKIVAHTNFSSKAVTFTVQSGTLGTFLRIALEDVLPDPFFCENYASAGLVVALNKASGEAIKTFAPKVYMKDSGALIDYFYIAPSFIDKQNNLTLKWCISKAENYGIYYKDTLLWPLSELAPLVNGKCKGVKVLDEATRNRLGDMTAIYLKAEVGEKIATRFNPREIINVQKNAWITRNLSEIINQSAQVSKVLNLINNEFDGKIWALAKNGAGKIRLWNSSTGQDWQALEDKKDDIHIYIEETDIYRPAVFFAPSDKAATELYFVGGSLLDDQQVSNQMHSYNIHAYTQTGNRRQEKGKRSPMPPRMGHACLVFPDENGKDNIWVLGGADDEGNGLNDIWRWDGNRWHQMTSPADFSKRCQFSATVLTDKYNKKQEIWLGGGLDSFQGDPVNDIWRYYNKNGTWTWECVQTTASQKLTLGNNLVASALIGLGDKAFAITTNEGGRGDFSKWIEKEQGENYSFGSQSFATATAWADAGIKQSDGFYLQTLSFNGSIWLMAQSFIDEGDIKLSKLYYLIPE